MEIPGVHEEDLWILEGVPDILVVVLGVPVQVPEFNE